MDHGDQGIGHSMTRQPYCQSPCELQRVQWVLALMTRVWSWLKGAWGGAAAVPLSPAELQARAEAGRRANAASAVHRLDMTTRTMLSAAVAQIPQVKGGLRSFLSLHPCTPNLLLSTNASSVSNVL